MPIIPAAQEAEIRRITVPSQPQQIVHETPISKKTISKKSWWSGLRCRLRVEFKLQYHKNNTNKNLVNGVCYVFGPQTCVVCQPLP
jgi:hypothetical protein